jgi:GDPmannose 4,6-dehydratase
MLTGKHRKTALILGITGQDGAHLAADLLSQGWKVYGGFRRGHATKLWRLEELGILDQLNLVNLNLHEPHQVIEVISQLQPNCLYHLAGESFVADSFQQPRSIIETNTLGTLNVLEAVRIFSPETRLFFASSAEVFGVAGSKGALNEQSPLRPNNPYGISKLAAQQLVSVYRERHGIHAVCGIMFNHEGPLRARNFVTRKITFHLARLRIEGGPPMQLGAFDAARDWGSAVDYAQAIPMTLNLDTPQDFVFATGKETTVRDFLELAGEAAGFAPEFEGDGTSMICRDEKSGDTLATVSPQHFRPFDTPALVGNSTHLKQATGFNGSRDISVIVEEMVESDLRRRKNGATHV